VTGSPRPRAVRGVALLEVLTSLGAMLPVLFAVISTSTYTFKVIQASERASADLQTVRSAEQRLQDLLRSATLGSLTLDPTAVAPWTDQTLTSAESLITNYSTITTQLRGKTIQTPTAVSVQSRSVTFQSVVDAADLQLSDPALGGSGLSATRSVFFQIEPGEAWNGVDDDGDGFVDEGALQYFDGARVHVLISVTEDCTLTLAGQGLTLDLVVPHALAGDQVRRSRVTRTYGIRNP